MPPSPPTIPISSGYSPLPSGGIDLATWWTNYVHYRTDYLAKTDLSWVPFLLEASPRRWYSRFVINLYAPLARPTAKLFMRFSLDYESMILGTCYGFFLVFRHFADYNMTKSPEFRPGKHCLCCGRSTHYYRKWSRSYINPKKFIAHDRKLFWRKLLWAMPHALMYGCMGSLFCQIFFSLTYSCVMRHFPLFMAATHLTYETFLNDKNYADLDIHYSLYRYPELTGLAMLMAYSLWRVFRNYSAGIPFERVLIG